MKTWFKWVAGVTGAGALVLAGLALGTTLNLTGCSPGGRHDSGTATTPSSTQPKQLYTCGMHPQVVQDHPGNCPICHMKLTPMRGGGGGGASSSAAQGQQRKILYWWD